MAKNYIIKIHENEFPMTMSVQDIMDLFKVGRKKAKKILDSLNQELEEKGCKTIQGRVFTEYLFERYYIV